MFYGPAMENEITGIILDSQERGRSSRYVKLLSNEGAVFVLVPKSQGQSQWSDLTQPLHLVRYMVQESSRGSIFKEGVVDERFSGIRRQYALIDAAQKMRLVALKIVKPGLPCPDFFQILQIHLQALSNESYQHISAGAILSSFLLKTLIHEGLFSSVNFPQCSLCQKQSEFMSLAKTFEWYCHEHSNYSLNPLWFDQHKREQLLFLAQNRRLSALSQLGESDLSPTLLPLILAL